MRYREYQPPPSLGRFIECFWTLEESSATLAPAQKILPDGCIELILNFAEPFRQRAANGRTRVQPQRFIVGQMQHAIQIQPRGRAAILAVRFHPAGAYPLLRMPIDELTGAVHPLDSVAAALERDIERDVFSRVAWPARVAALGRTLERRMLAAPSADFAVEFATAKILAGSGAARVSHLMRGLNLSARQLERRFLQRVGIGPKSLGRILRFQRVFQAVEQQRADWAAVAQDCGYYDQAHLIKDFQQFAGETPALLLAHSDPLTELFTRKNRMSNFYNTPPPAVV